MLTNMMDVEQIGDSTSQNQAVVDACFEVITEVCHLPNDLLGREAIIDKLVASEPLLSKILLKSQKRSLMDKKVAPGSDAVKRSILNARYCLCLLNTNLAKHYELQSTTYDMAITYYQRALIWYPKSIEAGHLLGLCLRSRAVTTENLEFVQYLWERAMAAAQTLEETVANIQTDEPSLGLHSVSEQKVLDILLSTSTASESLLSSVAVDSAIISSCVSQAQTSIIYREREVGKTLQDSLILFYCQENLLEKAFPLLLLKRYQWKLSQQVLTYAAGSASDTHLDARQLQLEARADFPFTFGYDSVLPEIYLHRLQHVFRPSAPFWSEHQYDFYSNCSRQVGYFSYLYPFREQAASNLIEQVIDIVYQTVIAQLAATEEASRGGSGRKSACLEALRSEATTAEWWVHSRPHTSGHQFHFDSDETAMYGGEQAQVSSAHTTDFRPDRYTSSLVCCHAHFFFG
jgi:hypothetical protein